MTLQFWVNLYRLTDGESGREFELSAMSLYLKAGTTVVKLFLTYLSKHILKWEQALILVPL